MSDYRLSDLLNLTIIQKMTDAHYRIAGMPIQIIDAIDGSVLVASGSQDVCVKFYRAHPVSLERCRESDNYIKDHLAQGEACQYKCQNGLWEIGMPIVIAGRHLATMSLGQFFCEGEEPDREYFIQLAHEFGFDVEEYLAALHRVPVFSREKVDSILEYDKTLVSFITGLAEHFLSKIEADEMIRDRERRFHAIFDQAYHFIGYLSLDGILLDANKTALKFTGVQEADVVGKLFWETPWWRHSPELQEKLRLAVGKAAKGESLRFDATHYAADGSLHHIDFSLDPVRDETGKIVLLVPQGRDITERKRAEEELRQREVNQKLIIDHLPFGVLLASIGNEKVIYHNPKFFELFGYSTAHFTDVSEWWPLAYPDPEYRKQISAEWGRRMAEAARTHGEIEPMEVLITCRDGSNKYARVTSKVIGDINFVTFLDLTERKRAEKEKQNLQDQLARAQKMESIGRLAGGVAHDFNNMLGVILGNAELALKKADQAHPVFGNLREIRKAAKHSADLTRQLLGFARKQTVAPRVLDLNETLNKTLTMLQPLVGEEIDLVWMPGPDLWQVRIDPAQIDQILMNLAANARDSIAGLGKVSIETENVIADEAYCAAHLGLVPREYVMLTVSDNGCGMDRETLANIFEPFFTTKEQGKGTGLGLATVYGIVKQNNGVINAYSEPGKGATFKIWLPRYVGKTAHALAESPMNSAIGGPETVLLVEDESMLLDLAQDMLKKLGYTVLIADTPDEAIRLAEQHAGDIHLLMTDVVMPEMNGPDLAKRLLSVRPNLKRLFMSGYTANVIAHQGVLEEGIHFIQKPFSMKDLATKVREALDQQ